MDVFRKKGKMDMNVEASKVQLYLYPEREESKGTECFSA